MRAALAGSKYERALPNIPGFGEGQGNIVEPLDDAASSWLQINADPALIGPLKLLGNYLQAGFDTPAGVTINVEWDVPLVQARIT